jgi:SEC-C motif domain protein
MSFGVCCEPLINGEPAKTAVSLMRSRYSAFVVGYLDYVQKTSALEALLKFNRAELEQSLPTTEWLGLEILNTEAGRETDATGFVTFEVRFRQDGRLYRQAERSEFRRIGADWRYCRGEVSFTRNPPLIQIGRNDPCSCGSGKKCKKCCGAR